MADPFPKIKVAAVQASPVYMDREATVEKACRLIEEAGDQGAKIAAFPESFISGYPFYYVTLLSNPFSEDKKRFVDLYKSAIEVGGPETDKLCQAARKSNLYVIIGINERDPLSIGTLYNSQLFIDPQGGIMGVHRKLAPTVYEKLVYASGDGSHLNVFKTDWGEMGGLICGEHANSLAKFSLIARGEKIHIASWAGFPQDIFPREQNESVLFRIRQHAHEGKLFVVSSSGHCSQEMIDCLCNTKEEKARLKPGGGCTAIVGVNGEFLAGPLYDREGIVFAEIDFEKIVEAKMIHDVLGHYSRFDVLSLNFNDRKLEPIHYADQTNPLSDRAGAAIKMLKNKIDNLERRLDSILERKKEEKD